METARVDRWLWSIRLCKTRADATELCRGGHVKIGGRTAKPAAPVRVGDRIEAVVHGRERIVEVTRIIEKRVGAPIAVECYIDHSPPPPEREHGAVPYRERGSGRPTKKDRREMERLRGRNR